MGCEDAGCFSEKLAGISVASELGNNSEIADHWIVFIGGWDREADQGSVRQVRDPPPGSTARHPSIAGQRLTRVALKADTHQIAMRLLIEASHCDASKCVQENVVVGVGRK
jgi:hypothetical protein